MQTLPLQVFKFCGPQAHIVVTFAFWLWLCILFDTFHGLHGLLQDNFCLTELFLVAFLYFATAFCEEVTLAEQDELLTVQTDLLNCA